MYHSPAGILAAGTAPCVVQDAFGTSVPLIIPTENKLAVTGTAVEQVFWALATFASKSINVKELAEAVAEAELQVREIKGKRHVLADM